MLKGATVLNILVYWKSFNRLPAGNYMFKVNNRNTRISYEICSKLTIKWIYLIYVYNWICEESFISEQSCSNLLHKFASTDVISASLHCVKNVQIRSFFSPNAGKYGPEKTPYLDTCHAVLHISQLQVSDYYFQNFYSTQRLNSCFSFFLEVFLIYTAKGVSNFFRFNQFG